MPKGFSASAAENPSRERTCTSTQMRHGLPITPDWPLGSYMIHHQFSVWHQVHNGRAVRGSGHNFLRKHRFGTSYSAWSGGSGRNRVGCARRPPAFASRGLRLCPRERRGHCVPPGPPAVLPLAQDGGLAPLLGDAGLGGHPRHGRKDGCCQDRPARRGIVHRVRTIQKDSMRATATYTAVTARPFLLMTRPPSRSVRRTPGTPPGEAHRHDPSTAALPSSHGGS